MTVSRVINGTANVTEATRNRVFEAIERLNYRPNQIARSLREQRSRQIGIIVPNLEDSFFGTCAQAVSLVAMEHGYSVNIALSYEDPEIEFNEAMIMLLRHVEGLVVIPARGSGTRLAGSEFRTLPIVTLDRPLSKDRFDSVVVQNKNGASIAVRHLIAHGHKEIAYLGLSDDLYTLRARQDGYRHAMTRANLTPVMLNGNSTQGEMSIALRALLAKNPAPTALFSSNGLTTQLTLHALSELKVAVPKSIALVGFDDFESADLLTPAVTVVRQPTKEMGRIGANLLFTRLTSDDPEPTTKQVVLPVELVVRGSCGDHSP